VDLVARLDRYSEIHKLRSCCCLVNLTVAVITEKRSRANDTIVAIRNVPCTILRIRAGFGTSSSCRAKNRSVQFRERGPTVMQ